MSNTITTPNRPDYADVVDLEQYPSHKFDSDEGKTMIDSCRKNLAKDGCCTLNGFIKPEAVAKMVALVNKLEDKTWNIYFQPFDETREMDYLLASHARSAKHGNAYDHTPDGAPLRRLYESDDLTQLHRRRAGKAYAVPQCRPLDALQFTRFHPGEELGRHFDNSEFSITVMYRQAVQCGDFESGENKNELKGGALH